MGLPRVTLDDFALLAALEAQGSISLACQAMGISYPTGLRRIRSLETALREQLVVSDTRGSVLTQAGRIIVRCGRGPLQALDEANREVQRRLHGMDRLVRIATFPSVAELLLPEVLAALKYRWPEVTTTLKVLPSDRGLELVQSGEADVAIIADYGDAPGPWEGAVVEPLFYDRIDLVVPDDHWAAVRSTGTAVSLYDLRNESWACSVSDGPARRQLVRAAESAGIEIPAVFQTESFSIILALVKIGQAIGFIPRLNQEDLKGAVRVKTAETMGRRILVATNPASGDHSVELVTLLKRTIGDRLRAS